jgi:ABC-type branched-subunit amino acid transport system ATPase component
MPPELLRTETPAVARTAAPALQTTIDVLRDRVPVARDIHLEVAGGSAIGILGRNGAGKTSLLAGIMGFLPTVGQVHVLGSEISRWPTHRRARHGLALVPQGRRLFAELTVAENLRTAQVSPSADGPEFDVFELFPNLSALLDRCAGVLSGGQQQQVAIARALLRRPKLLLLDEPTEGLAPSVVEEVVAALSRLRAGGLTLVIAEQRIDVVSALCEVVAVMRAGEITTQGHPASEQVRERLLAL